MITCPSCNHQNPEGSLQCENCYTPLPTSSACPNCGASVLPDATFCGQCGFNLQAENPIAKPSIEETAIGSLPDVSMEELSTTGAIPEMPLSEAESDILPETAMSSPINSPWDTEEEEDLTIGQPRVVSNVEPTEMMNPTPSPSAPDLDLAEETTGLNSGTPNSMPWEAESPDLDLDFNFNESNTEEERGIEVKSPELSEPTEIKLETESLAETPEPEKSVTTTSIEAVTPPDPLVAVNNLSGATQLQVQTASLLHLQSDTTIEIASNLNVVHIGKPNGQIPPDIDVAGFADSEVVSRLHADIRIEGDAYYIEDVGSSNGTYINHTPLLQGNRHRLRSGDRIALGKGDLVTFIFQLG